MTQFNLEWAKRGGVVTALGYELMKYQNKTFSDGTLLLCQFIHHHSLVSVKPKLLRMATREQCESCGVEYIERPQSSEELAELRKDKERLDFMTTKTDAGEWPKIFYNGFRYDIEQSVMGGWQTLGSGKTPRKAIDAAIFGEKNGI